jgi:hypothetical protein
MGDVGSEEVAEGQGKVAEGEARWRPLSVRSS